MKWYGSFLGCALLGGFAGAMVVILPEPSEAKPPAGYALQWFDEFEGDALDPGKWAHRQPGKRRDGFNVPDAVTVHGGYLTITTYTEGQKHYTGMLESKLTKRYGYWEARIKFAGAPGIQSAFWLQSRTLGKPIGDPGKAGVEIDIVEHRVTDRKGKNVSGLASLNLHWDGYGADHKHVNHTTTDLGLGTGFHVYGLEWTPTEYRFTIDGNLQWAVKEPISHTAEVIVLSSEINDKSWAGVIPTKGYGDRKTSQTKMTVDYIRYYEKQP